MLVAMTYNVFLFVSIIIGFSVGYAIVSLLLNIKFGSNAGQESCC